MSCQAKSKLLHEDERGAECPSFPMPVKGEGDEYESSGRVWSVVFSKTPGPGR